MRLQDLAPLGIAFVLVTIILSVGADILGGLSDNQAVNSTARDITLNATSGLMEMSNWLPTIGLVVASAVIVGIVVTYFRFRD